MFHTSPVDKSRCFAHPKASSTRCFAHRRGRGLGVSHIRLTVFRTSNHGVSPAPSGRKVASLQDLTPRTIRPNLLNHSYNGIRHMTLPSHVSCKVKVQMQVAASAGSRSVRERHSSGLATSGTARFLVQLRFGRPSRDSPRLSGLCRWTPCRRHRSASASRVRPPGKWR